MLRHPSLIPLSRQHQHALALCVLIKRGLSGNPSPEATAKLTRKAADLFEIELRSHFDIEERILFPVIRENLGPTRLAEELIADHRRLEALAGKLEQPAVLREFASVLSTHIRREERELFEQIQARLPPEALEELGNRIGAEVVRVCL